MKKVKAPLKRIFLSSIILGIIISLSFDRFFDYILNFIKNNLSISPFEEIITILIVGIIIGIIIYFFIDVFLTIFAGKLLKYLINELRAKELLPSKFSVKKNIKSGRIYEEIVNIFNSFIHTFSLVKEDKDKFSKTIQKYMDPSLKAEIESRKAHEIYLGGKKKIATIFFSDLRGFTQLTELHEANDVIEILNDYFGMATKIISNNRGRVNKYIGDAILAIFEEAPKYADYIDCDKAIIAALDIQTQFKFLLKKWKDKIDPTLNLGLGIGLARGEVVLGNIGSEERMEYTVIGDTVNLASRLCDIAKSGQVIITEEIYHIVENYVVIDVLPAIEIKGKTGMHNIYSVITRKMIV